MKPLFMSLPATDSDAPLNWADGLSVMKYYYENFTFGGLTLKFKDSSIENGLHMFTFETKEMNSIQVRGLIKQQGFDCSVDDCGNLAAYRLRVTHRAKLVQFVYINAFGLLRIYVRQTIKPTRKL